jgi:hypothetical protein
LDAAASVLGYFVGFALVAAALSIILMQHVGWSATLLGIMIFLFVLMIHLPNVVANPKDRQKESGDSHLISDDRI